MTNILKAIGFVVAGVVIGYLATLVFHAPVSQAPVETKVGGVYNTVQQSFPDGAVIGDRAVIFKSGTIGPGQNQGYWDNTTGRQVFVSESDVLMGWTSGTASSSLVFYVATSTATSVSDYTRPVSSYMLVDGAINATSTQANASWITGTTTTSGKGIIPVNPGERLIFDIQERYNCKGATNCETATSTNRGIQSFFWMFRGVYQPVI